MDKTLLPALLTFALVTSISPGPNNLMLMASGANFGIRRTIPHMAGVGLGFMAMVLVVGLGLVQLLLAYPAVETGLRVASILYLLYLAWKIATAARAGATQTVGKPFTLLQAVLFQWVNPKAWGMALTALATYAPSNSLGAVAMVAAAFGFSALLSTNIWVFLGQRLQIFLSNQRRLRAFNIAMAALLIASLYPVLFS